MSRAAIIAKIDALGMQMQNLRNDLKDETFCGIQSQASVNGQQVYAYAFSEVDDAIGRLRHLRHWSKYIDDNKQGLVVVQDKAA